MLVYLQMIGTDEIVEEVEEIEEDIMMEDAPIEEAEEIILNEDDMNDEI